MRTLVLLMVVVLAATGTVTPPVWADGEPVSDATLECLDCHAYVHPGLVADWRTSRHARTTPAQAGTLPPEARRLSADNVPAELLETTVGCAECHTLRAGEHADTFDHNGHDVHVVVSPADCAVCHPVEAREYDTNLMAWAHTNLADNPLYRDLQRSIIGRPRLEDGRLRFDAADADTRAEACFHCHGTRLSVTGTRTRDTALGEMDFPVIDGWPNQGSGRINPDGSRGACSVCHTRHAFAIEMARQPYTCKQCHVGSDVPAVKVYTASKHGNIFSSRHDRWDFSAVPWQAGRDFTAPTCAVCHMSLLVNGDGEVIASRTHGISDRLAWRIFGLIYAHPQPRGPDTRAIRNRQGLALPTDLDGTPVSAALIDPAVQAERTAAMQAVCGACHDRSWTEGHWRRFRNTIATTNRTVKTATDLMQQIWQRGWAAGIAAGESPFDEAVERRWSDMWLFHANHVRFAAAMAGGGDYGVFADGRYQLSQRLMELAQWYRQQQRLENLHRDAPGSESP